MRPSQKLAILLEAEANKILPRDFTFHGCGRPVLIRQMVAAAMRELCPSLSLRNLSSVVGYSNAANLCGGLRVFRARFAKNCWVCDFQIELLEAAQDCHFGLIRQINAACLFHANSRRAA